MPSHALGFGPPKDKAYVSQQFLQTRMLRAALKHSIQIHDKLWTLTLVMLNEWLWATWLGGGPISFAPQECGISFKDQSNSLHGDIAMLEDETKVAEENLARRK